MGLTCRSKNYQEICEIWGLTEHYNEFHKNLDKKTEECKKKADEEGRTTVEFKRARQDEEDEEDESEFCC